MDDTVEVKWDQPLEAVHRDGRIVPVKLDPKYQAPDKEGFYTLLEEPEKNSFYCFTADGKAWVSPDHPWTIRNTAPKPAQEPVQGQMGSKVAPEVVERLVALCEAVAEVPASPLGVEARAIQALLEPVDPEKDVVDRIYAEYLNDDMFALDAIRQAVAAGRNLERQAIEKGRG